MEEDDLANETYIYKWTRENIAVCYNKINESLSIENKNDENKIPKFTSEWR